MEYSFLFLLMQKLWKSIKKCKTYSRKATGLFFSDTVYNTTERGNFSQIMITTLRRVDNMISDIVMCL